MSAREGGRREVIGKSICRTFDGMTPMLEFVGTESDTAPEWRNAGWESDGGWTGSESMSEALELARDGWHDVREQVDSLAGLAEVHLAETIDTGFAWSMDVTGEFVDVATFLAGEPECMASVTLQPMAKQGKVVTLLYAICVSGSVDTPTLVKRGAVILALCEILKRAGYSLEIWVDATTNPDRKMKECLTTLTRVKTAAEPIDIDSLMFPLAHPSMFRRLMFSAWEQESREVRKRFNINSGYGGVPKGVPDYVRERVNPDVCLDATLYSTTGRDGDVADIDRDPIGWLKHRLEGLDLIRP